MQVKSCAISKHYLCTLNVNGNNVTNCFASCLSATLFEIRPKFKLKLSCPKQRRSCWLDQSLTAAHTPPSLLHIYSKLLMEYKEKAEPHICLAAIQVLEVE